MKIQYNILLLGLVIGFVQVSCRKYVEVEQYNRRSIKYTDDFQYLLNNGDVFSPAYSYPVLSSDDLVILGNQQTNKTETVFWPYTWAEEYTPNLIQDIGWNTLYKQIYTANEVLAGVMNSANGTENQKKSIAAEAKVHRAYAYLLLVNQYGAIYDPNTASTAVGVPLLITPDLFPFLQRSPLSAVYTQVLKDLEEALPDLPSVATNNRHPDKAAVHAILSITHLYMRNFEKAGYHADEAMKGDRKLLNLSEIAAGTSTFPRRIANTETFLSKRNQQIYDEQLNPELIALLDENDLRLALLTQISQYNTMPTGARVSRKHTIAGEYPQGVDVGPSLPEIMLIKAEVLARTGMSNEAMTVVNELRKYRFESVNYVPLSAANGQEALEIVVEERRRELFATGKRWFDQRRFNLDNTLAKRYTRTFKEEEYVLEINSNRFIYPVASYNLDLNPEIGQSPR